MTFPLAFNPVEYYYWCDDRPEYPTCFPVELGFAGVLDYDCFARAWTETIGRHPMLSALVDSSGPRPIWIDGRGELPEIDWAEEGVPITGLTGPMDLTARAGIRCWVRVGSQASRILLRFHHAACDGLGASQFVEDLMMHYHREAVGSDNGLEIRPLQPERLSRRLALAQVAERPSFWLKLRYATAILRFWAPLLLRRPVPLAKSSDCAVEAVAVADHRMISEVLDKEAVRNLKTQATTYGVALNDLLLRDLFVVLGEWQTRNGGRANDRLRVNVPVSLRGAGDRALPAANRLSDVFLTRRLRDCRDENSLLQSIHEEMTDVRERNLSLRFLGGLAVASGIDGMMEWFLNRKRTYATVVFSNLGRVLNVRQMPREQRQIVCGGVLLNHVSAVPPVRPLTRASIAVITYGHELIVNLQGDLSCFENAQLHELLKCYMDRVKQTASGAS